jgi:hypothetical protein
MTNLTSTRGESIEAQGPYSTVIVCQCCICMKYLEIKRGGGNYGVSHSYCDTCADKIIQKYRTSSYHK